MIMINAQYTIYILHVVTISHDCHMSKKSFLYLTSFISHDCHMTASLFFTQLCYKECKRQKILRPIIYLILSIIFFIGGGILYSRSVTNWLVRQVHLWFVCTVEPLYCGQHWDKYKCPDYRGVLISGCPQ